VYDIVYDIILDDIKLMMLLVQDCVCVVAPYPFRIDLLEDFDPIGDMDVTGGGAALWKDLSSSNLCGSSGILKKEDAGIQGSWR
jgi:hypothetical protein